MNLESKVLSDVVVFNKYAKYLPSLERRETFDEICNRYQKMMVGKYPSLKEDIGEAMKLVRSYKILPSMRGMQFSGPAIEHSESRVYNCAYLPVDDYRSFSETMFLLLGGSGVGYGLQKFNIDSLPPIAKSKKSQKFVVDDSKEGWSDAIKYLMKSYLGSRAYKPRFDFSSIREKGERLITSGGKAPGSGPLKRCLFLIEELLENKEEGSKLTSLECHDILCFIADAVLSGGIRRAAMIALFDKEDTLMLGAKAGNWWELNPQRGRANNSVILNRNTTTLSEFNSIFQVISSSLSGEPGIYFSNNEILGTNPCCEISLKPFQFCNLTEINASTIVDQEDFNSRAKYAALLGTLQAGFTDFHYLRPIWQKTTEEDALIGVGMTGIASNSLVPLNILEAVNVVKVTNENIAERIGINSAARLTTIKPSGTTSCVLGCSSGIHSWYSKYYIRRMQLNADDPMIPYFKSLFENKLLFPYKAIPGSWVLEIPQKAPEDAILRKESPIKFLNRVKFYFLKWVKPGHVSGDNTNNVSATVFVKPNEWETVGKWMWENKDSFNGLSVLPYDGGSYKQAPFEEITEDVFNVMSSYLKDIDLKLIVEKTDETSLVAELACSGGSCEII